MVFSWHGSAGVKRREKQFWRASKEEDRRRGEEERTHQAHSLAKDEDEGLVSDGGGRCDEEEAESDVEEADGAEDGVCIYESHFEGVCLWSKTLRLLKECWWWVSLLSGWLAGLLA